MNYIYKIISIDIILIFFNKFNTIIQDQNYLKDFESNYYYYNLIQNLNDLINTPKVVYTVLLGKYDNITPIKKEKNFDYFLITDQFPEKNFYLNWTIIHIKKKLDFSKKRYIVKMQRFYKLHPHLLFSNYNLSIYIDSTFSIKRSLNEFLLRILSKNILIYVLEHPFRNTITNEFREVLRSGRESKKIINKIKRKYKRENFSDDNGLSENCLIIRKHNELKCIEFMEKWFHEVKHNSHRDQLSFNYVLWKTGYKIVKYISKNYIYDYFNQTTKHLKEIKF